MVRPAAPLICQNVDASPGPSGVQKPPSGIASDGITRPGSILTNSSSSPPALERALHAGGGEVLVVGEDFSGRECEHECVEDIAPAAGEECAADGCLGAVARVSAD